MQMDESLTLAHPGRTVRESLEENFHGCADQWLLVGLRAGHRTALKQKQALKKLPDQVCRKSDHNV